jgi:transposase InsO family protein
VADVGSRRIVGFALANRMPDDLVIEAIEAALRHSG